MQHTVYNFLGTSFDLLYIRIGNGRYGICVDRSPSRVRALALGGKIRRMSALTRHWSMVARLIENLKRALLQSMSAALVAQPDLGVLVASPHGALAPRVGPLFPLRDVTTRGGTAWMNAHPPGNSLAYCPDFMVVPLWLSSYLAPISPCQT